MSVNKKAASITTLVVGSVIAVLIVIVYGSFVSPGLTWAIFGLTLLAAALIFLVMAAWIIIYDMLENHYKEKRR